MTSHHKNISLRDVNWGFLSQGLNIATGLLLLPVVLIFLSRGEVGLWFVFSSLAGLAQLLELGLQPTIARYVAYIYGGAQQLETEGFSPNVRNGPINYMLLGQVFGAAKRIYLYITLLVLFVLIGGGSAYISTLLVEGMSWQKVFIAWLLFSGGFITNFYFGYYNGFLQGRGEITATNQVVVVSRLIMIVTGSILLVAGCGLIGLGFASLLSSVVSRMLLRRLFWRDELPEISHLKTSAAVIDKQASAVLWHNSVKLGWVYLGAFLITRMNMLIASSLLGLETAASYGLTVQIFITLSALASTIYTIRLPALNAEQISGRKDRILASFGQSLVISWLLYIGIAAILIIFGNSLLAIIGSHTRLMQTNLLILFALIMFLEMNQSLCSSCLMTFNEIPFVLPALVSGFFIVASSILFVSVFHLGVWALLLSQGIVQLAYNNWKWPKEAAKKLGCSFFHLLRSGFEATYTKVFARRVTS